MKLYLSVLLLLVGGCAFGQEMYFPDRSCKVYRGTTELTLAWCGGFNNPQFSAADLNKDGLNDLVSFENGKGITTFINVGTAGNPDYRYVPQYALDFPPVNNYLILKDYNCDGIADLFHSGYTGFAVYKGYYDSRNHLCFTYYKNLFYSNDLSAGGAANAYSNPGDIPSIVDVDNDGDLDMVSYNILGGTMNYYRNMRVENGQPCDSITIALKDRCWGKVYQGFYRTHVLHYSCDNSGLLKGVAEKTTHSGNTPCLFDYDMDGDYDYLDGSISFAEMTFLKNGRAEFGGKDSMVQQDTTWQGSGKPIVIPTWPAAFNIDVDIDGKKDLLVAPNLSASENYRCVWYYKNFTIAGSPDWRFVSDTFLVDKSIDMGTAAYPALFDFDKDGKLDLFVGSDGFRQASGGLRSRMAHYRNTSTAGNPSFTLQSLDFLRADTAGFQGLAPAMGDIDNDGKADLLMGHNDGSISYYKNYAASNTVAPDWRPVLLTLTDAAGTAINVDGNAAPFVYDVDKDGKPDLLIGNLYGTLQYYQNVSTATGSVALRLVNTSLGQAQSDGRQILGCNSTPFVGKLDNTGRDYLLMGSNSGKLYRFDGISSGDTTLIYNMLDTQYSFIDSTHLFYNRRGSALGVYGGLRSAPAVGDIDGDGNYEMLVGQVRGGINYYKRKPYDNTSVASVAQALSVTLWPNPTQNLLQVSWQAGLLGEVWIRVFDIQGRLLEQLSVGEGTTAASVATDRYATGLYLLEAANGQTRVYSKFVVQH